MRRLFRIALAALLAGGLGGCARPADPPGVVRLRFCCFGDKQESDLANALARVFERRHPNIRISVEPVPASGYQMKLTMQSVAGTLPDVVFLTDSLVPIFLRYHVVRDLRPFLQSDPSFHVSDIYPQMLQTGMDSSGNLLMLPRELGVVVMFYNRTLFRRAGLPDPPPDWTYSDFVRIARKLTLRDSQGHIVQYGFTADFKWPGLYGPWIVSDGGRLLSPDHQHSALGAPASLQGLHDLIDLVTVYHVAAPPEVAGSMQGADMFSRGLAAMTPGVFPGVPARRATMKAFDWDVQVMPAGRVRRAVTMGAAGYGISSASRRPKEAWAFLRLILSPEGQRLL